MNTKTRIMALAVIAASAPLWAQQIDEWPSWQGKDNVDKKEWDEMGACWTGLMDASRSGCLRRFAGKDKGFAKQRPGPAKCAGMRRGKEP
jgi:hypothetical protein